MVKRLKRLPPQVSYFMEVASKLAHSSGLNIYLVGGIVRDLILGKESMDYDIVIEGDGIEFAKTISYALKTNFRKHHAFGTATVYYGIYKIDVASCRREYYSHRGALPRVSPASLKEDLFRRDFTINAMAVSLNKHSYGRLIDSYNGYSDLKHGLIRVMHDNSFLDDPTRILRAIRFEKRFSFKIERHTMNLLKVASLRDALKFIDEQRLRDELILILKEKPPVKYIKRIQKLVGFSFIDEKLRLKEREYQLFIRIEKTLQFYKNNFKRHRSVEEWLVYLMGIASKLPRDKVIKFCRDFGFRKGETNRLIISLKYKKAIKSLSKKRIKKSKIFKILKSLSFENIIFFYAYFKDRVLRGNIVLFLDSLVGLKLKVSGQDLKSLGFKPHHLYSKALERLIHAKIEKGLVTKDQEIKEIEMVFKRLKKKYHL